VLDALDARVRDDVGPPGGLAAVVSGFETLAALAGAWLPCSAELRGLRQEVRRLAVDAERRERECSGLRQELAAARERLRALGQHPYA
jgi:hypothetical protein